MSWLMNIASEPTACSKAQPSWLECHSWLARQALSSLCLLVVHQRYQPNTVQSSTAMTYTLAPARWVRRLAWVSELVFSIESKVRLSIFFHERLS